MTSPDNGLFLNPLSVKLLGKDVFPIAFGMTKVAAEPFQDPTTRTFAPNHDNDLMHLKNIMWAYELGQQIFDTASAYGDSEVVLGQALREMDRDEVVVISKVGIVPDDNIVDAMERSAQRLGTVPDAIALHNRWDGEESRMYDSIAQFNRGVERGYAKSFAVCNLQPHEYEKVVTLSEIPVGFYQAKLNLFHPRPDAPITLKISREHNIPQMASAAFDNGKYFSDSFREERPEVSSLVSNLSEKYDMTAAQVALFATMSLGTIPIVETSKPKNMIENTNAVYFEMERGDVKKLQEILLGAS